MSATLLPPPPPKGDLRGTVWFTEGPLPRREREYFIVTHEGERGEVTVRRWERYAGRIAKGARAQVRHRALFTGPGNTFHRLQVKS